MKSRTQRPARKRSANKPRTENAVPDFSFPNITQLIEDGEITIGTVGSAGCFAAAADDDCTYAMLVRRRGESLHQLLVRLDQAIDNAFTLGIFTDEINR
jgi:hypothetical protein